MINRTDCIILGGGAAGLAACAQLARNGLHVTLVEKLDRVGKKIMAAGNGRCNLSNADMNPAYYRDSAAFVREVYRQTTPEETLQFFSSLGLMTTEEECRIYPRTMMAASVLDVLRAACTHENVNLRTSCGAVSISPARSGGWSVQLSGGASISAPVVLMCTGGSAAPHLGTDGSGAAMMKALGHSVTPQYPALVQLRCKHSALRSLKGVRVHASLTLLVGGAPAASETGELLFTDYGLSGVCVFQLSGLAARALGMRKQVRLLIHLLPEIASKDLADWLDQRITQLTGADALGLLTGVFPRILSLAVLRQAAIPPETAACALNPKQRRQLINAICAFPLPVTGTQSFRHAQVTSGGVSLSDVDPQTMASRLHDGLYLAGEVLDVDGPCGGYNLHFAFASALTAAKSILSQNGC